ncbi:UNVERIFIED_CONTAM: hypothetical protein Sangu_1473100 [Sesamum angustifolium]|uniref:Uncharacterized protein n=1 Tax=Sesamum angustifolium TaxID=2727405 RepID=A0AAW2MNR2_9LAMI
MDQVMNKVGSYWLGQQASKEFNSVGNEINALSNNLEDGAKWLVHKMKGSSTRNRDAYEVTRDGVIADNF